WPIPVCVEKQGYVRLRSLIIVADCWCSCQFAPYSKLFETEWGKSNSSRGSFRESLYALVPPGVCSCCPLLSNSVDLGLSPLLSLLLSCFWCMRNRRVSNYLQNKGVAV